MQKYTLSILVIFISMLLIACKNQYGLWQAEATPDWKVKRVPDRISLPQGDPDAGFDYLIYGDYIGTGIPYSLIKKAAEKDKDSVFSREGVNAFIDYGGNVFEAANGIQVINGNCFTCHAGEVDGQLIIGVGNTLETYDKNFSLQANLLNKVVGKKYKNDSLTQAAFDPFGKFFKAMAPDIELNNPGVNPAFRLAEACVQHRDPVDLSYVDEPNFDIISYNIGADVPPLWNVKKKNMLYYNGSGRGNFPKLLMQASFLGVVDTLAARKSHDHFDDVLAWLESLEAPVYPKAIDQELSQAGEKVFTVHCSKCHGTYGEIETYPNKIVSLDVVKTDPGYATYAYQSPFNDWYNESWYATSPPHSSIEASLGYVAPPLDGIWASAPYLHNGSVPTLEALLNSQIRPTYWKRSKDSHDYDWEHVGWKYSLSSTGAGKRTYDTTLPGYGNEGHYFGDKLSDQERKAVIEYLKSL